RRVRTYVPRRTLLRPARERQVPPDRSGAPTPCLPPIHVHASLPREPYRLTAPSIDVREIGRLHADFQQAVATSDDIAFFSIDDVATVVAKNRHASLCSFEHSDVLERDRRRRRRSLRDRRRRNNNRRCGSARLRSRWRRRGFRPELKRISGGRVEL